MGPQPHYYVYRALDGVLLTGGTILGPGVAADPTLGVVMTATASVLA